MPQRRQMLVMAGAAMAAPLMVRTDRVQAAEPGKLTFVYGTQEGSVSSLPLLVAQSQGFLAQERLEPDFVFAPSSNATAAALASGQIDLCARVVTAVVALRSKGIDARLIAAVTPKSDYNILVRKGSKVPVAGKGGAAWQDTIRALKGSTIATNGPGSPIDLQIQDYFREAGLAPTDFTGVAIGEGAAQIAALTMGTVDAVVYTTLVARQTEDRGVATVVLSIAESGPELVSNMASIGVTTIDRFLTRNPTFGDRYRRAIGRALIYMMAPENNGAIVKLAVANGQAMAAPLLGKHLAELVGKYSVTFSAQQVQNAIDFEKRTGQLDKSSPITPADITSPEALR